MSKSKNLKKPIKIQNLLHRTIIAIYLQYYKLIGYENTGKNAKQQANCFSQYDVKVRTLSIIHLIKLLLMFSLVKIIIKKKS